MSKPFEEALKAYFAEKDGLTDVSVDVSSSEGYHYSSYTFEEAYVEITVRGTKADGSHFWNEYRNESTGDFMKDLFAWEDGS
jgi:hypothetical protein